MKLLLPEAKINGKLRFSASVFRGPRGAFFFESSEMGETTEKSAFLRGKNAITHRPLKGLSFLGVSLGGVEIISTGFMPQNQLLESPKNRHFTRLSGLLFWERSRKKSSSPRRAIVMKPSAKYGIMSPITAMPKSSPDKTAITEVKK